MSKTLTDTQLVLLSSASQREDHCLTPPTGARLGPARKAVAKLLEAGLVREIRPRKNVPVWRRDEETEQAFALKLTTAGLKAIAAEASEDTPTVDDSEAGERELHVIESERPEPSENAETAAARSRPAPDEPPASNSNASAARGRERGEVAAAEDRYKPRANSKLAVLVDLLSRDGGATLSELTSATGWLPHTTRAAMTRLRQRGFGLERLRNEADGASTFQIRSDRHPAQGAGQ